MRVFIIIVIALALLGWMIVDMIQVNRCCMCSAWILGKPERIEDVKPICDACYSKIQPIMKEVVWQE